MLEINQNIKPSLIEELTKVVIDYSSMLELVKFMLMLIIFLFSLVENSISS